jgi:hypothetical protein
MHCNLIAYFCSPTVTILITSQTARQIRKASWITFSLSLLLGLVTWWQVDGAVILGICVIALAINLVALKIGQELVNREFAAVVGSDNECNRPVILFLRSFDDAASSIRVRLIKLAALVILLLPSLVLGRLNGPLFGEFLQRDIEETLDEAIGSSAYFVAIGDKRVSYGSAKLLVNDHDWQAAFRTLTQRAKLILMMAGATPSVEWELSQIFGSRDLLMKTVFIQRRADRLKYGFEAVELWDALRKTVFGEFGVRLPAYSSEGGVLRISRDGQTSETIALEPFIWRLKRCLKNHADGELNVDELWRSAMIRSLFSTSS